MTRKKTVRKVEPEIVGSKNQKSSADDLCRDLAPYRDESTAVAVYEKDCAKIEAMHSIPEFTFFDAKMAALESYAKTAKDKKAAFTVSALRIRNMRKAGWIIADMKKKGLLADRGHNKQKNRKSSRGGLRLLYLPDIGVKKNQSMYWQAVAAIPKKTFDGIVERARASADKEGAVHAIAPHALIKELVTGGKRTGRQRKIADEKGIGRGPFVLLYADPPWRFSDDEDNSENDTGEYGGNTRDYPTMSLDDIKSLLDDRLIEVTDDAVLFLWGVIPLLPQALEVMAAWGFEYRHAVAWDKCSGTKRKEYFDGRWEILLLGYRGKTLMPSVGNLPNALSIPKKGGHSRKPEEFRRMIEWMYPALDFDTRIELFGRPPTAPARGWTAVVEGVFKNHPDDIADAVNLLHTDGSLYGGSLYGPKATLVAEALDEPDKFFPPEVLAAMGLCGPWPPKRR